jgi:hypothetical protein
MIVMGKSSAMAAVLAAGVFAAPSQSILADDEETASDQDNIEVNGSSGEVTVIEHS